MNINEFLCKYAFQPIITVWSKVITGPKWQVDN